MNFLVTEELRRKMSFRLNERCKINFRLTEWSCKKNAFVCECLWGNEVSCDLKVVENEVSSKMKSCIE